MAAKPTQNWLIAPPLNDTKPTTAQGLVIYHFGMGETSTAPMTDTRKTALIEAVRAAGYIVASTSDHGDNCGNSAALADYIELLNYCMDVWKVKRVIHLSQSMGGLSGLLTVSNRALPVRGWAGIYPVCNLQNFHDNVTFTAAVRTAYGIAGDDSDYAAKTAGHDPVLLNGSKFGGLRIRFYASPDDVVVPKVNNTDVMKALVAGTTLESDVVVCSGDHGDASHFQSADLISFLDRCV